MRRHIDTQDAIPIDSTLCRSVRQWAGREAVISEHTFLYNRVRYSLLIRSFAIADLVRPLLKTSLEDTTRPLSSEAGGRVTDASGGLLDTGLESK